MQATGRSAGVGTSTPCFSGEPGIAPGHSPSTEDPRTVQPRAARRPEGRGSVAVDNYIFKCFVDGAVTMVMLMALSRAAASLEL